MAAWLVGSQWSSGGTLVLLCGYIIQFSGINSLHPTTGKTVSSTRCVGWFRLRVNYVLLSQGDSSTIHWRDLPLPDQLSLLPGRKQPSSQADVWQRFEARHLDPVCLQVIPVYGCNLPSFPGLESRISLSSTVPQRGTATSSTLTTPSVRSASCPFSSPRFFLWGQSRC